MLNIYCYSEESLLQTNCTGKDNAPAATLHSRPKGGRPDLTPAPGDYNPEKSQKVVHDNSPKYTFGLKTQVEKPSQTPGAALQVLNCACSNFNYITYLIFVFDIPMSVHRNIITNYSQQDATFLEFISTDALHVSGGSSARHQEHITVHTASGIVNQYCC